MRDDTPRTEARGPATSSHFRSFEIISAQTVYGKSIGLFTDPTVWKFISTVPILVKKLSNEVWTWVITVGFNPRTRTSSPKTVVPPPTPPSPALITMMSWLYVAP